MGATISKLDTSRYFDDPAAAAFANDIQNGDLPRVLDALRSGQDADVLGKNGMRPLFFVFTGKNEQVAKALVAAGGDPNARLAGGDPLLMIAVRLEDPMFTRVLLEGGADPNLRGENQKPIIHEAVLADHPEQVRMLAGAGADINVPWGAGSPLYAAVASMSWAAAAALLDLGADTEWRNPKGRSHSSAAETLCQFFTRERPLRIPPNQHAALRKVFEAFARRGVHLSCAAPTGEG